MSRPRLSDAHRRGPRHRSRGARHRVRAALVHLGRARPTPSSRRPPSCPSPGAEVGILLRNRPASIGLLLGVLARRRLRRHHQPRPRRRAHPRRHRRARPARPRRRPRRPRRARRRRVARPRPPRPRDLGEPLGRREGRPHAGGAAPARRRRAHAHQRHHRSAEADRPHLRDPRAGARRRQALRLDPRDAARSCARGVAVVNSPLVHLGGLFRVLQCVTDGRSFSLLERFTVDGWVDAVRRHRPATGEPRAGGAAHGARGRPRSRRPRQPPVGGVGHRAARPRRRRRVPGQVRRAGAHLLRRHRVRRRRGRVEPRGPPRVLGDEAGERRTGPRRAASCASSTACSRSRPASSATAAWVRTTDLARIDDDGFVWILGRADQAIIRGGFKVLPEDVKAALERHPAVRGAAVVGRDDRRLGAVPVAAVELRDDAGRRPPTTCSPTPAPCWPATSCRPRSGSSTQLPRTDSGKVDLAAVAALFAATAT